MTLESKKEFVEVNYFIKKIESERCLFLMFLNKYKHFSSMKREIAFAIPA